jgi:hypothetical protein
MQGHSGANAGGGETESDDTAPRNVVRTRRLHNNSIRCKTKSHPSEMASVVLGCHIRAVCVGCSTRQADGHMLAHRHMCSNVRRLPAANTQRAKSTSGPDSQA